MPTRFDATRLNLIFLDLIYFICLTLPLPHTLEMDVLMPNLQQLLEFQTAKLSPLAQATETARSMPLILTLSFKERLKLTVSLLPHLLMLSDK